MVKGVNFTVDTSKFDKVLKDYMKYTSRSFTEAVNQHAYYIAKNATNTTKGADKGRIKSKLESGAREYSGVPLAAILVNRERGQQGKKGLYGENMRSTVERYIRRIQAHTNFLRSGWLPAIKDLSRVVKGKKGKIPSGTQKKGRNFGGVRKAMDNGTFSSFCLMWNSALGKGNRKDIASSIIQQGAQEAIQQEQSSMRTYIKKKVEEARNKFWSH